MKKVISALLLGAMLTACSPATPSTTGAGTTTGTTTAGTTTAGTTTAAGTTTGDAQTKEVTVKGMAEGLKVKVTATADTIQAVEIVEHAETEGISDDAIANMPGKIVEANSLTVDGETGATYTSDGIKAAVEQALTDMGFDPADFK